MEIPHPYMLSSNHMKVLLTGATGLLGHHLFLTAPPGFRLTGIYDPAETNPSPRFPDRSLLPIEITDSAGLRNIFRLVAPDLVIHAAAQGNVNWCEENPQAATSINFGGTLNILRNCRTHHSRLIYISSNAVFSGDNAPYSEKSLPLPRNQYGRTKLSSEQAVAESGLSWLVVRPTLMYGWPPPGARDNQVTRVLASLRRRQPIEVVNDIFFTPLSAASAADIIWQVAARKIEGYLNIGGSERLSLYDLAVASARIFQLREELIIPRTADYFPSAAPRARDTSFNLSFLQRDLNIMPLSPSAGLQAMKQDEPAFTL